MWWLLIVFIFSVLYCCRMIYLHGYWKRKGVKQPHVYIIFKNIWELILRKSSLAEMVEKGYNMFSKERYIGGYQFSNPALILRDPDLIKQITVKDFDYFMDHRSFITKDMDPLWGNNLFALTGQNWREMRTILSPSFTSSKMKYMFSLISQSGQQYVDYFLNQKRDIVTVEMKDAFTRFTNDVIANTAFGIECNSLSDRKNEFYLMGKDLTNFTSIWRMLKLFGYALAPQIYKMFNTRLFPEKVANFFTNIIRTNMESREKHGIVRPDMIHLLLEAKKNGLKHEERQVLEGFAVVEESEVHKTSKKIEINEQTITAQAVLFFLAGFETVATLMCFLCYELGVNSDIQDKLIQEVDQTLKFCQGKLTYEALLGMKYMDMVVSETLRKWPITVAVDRVCTKPYIIEPKYPNEKTVCVEKQMSILLPIYGIHRDPEYYPNPERFDPERFNDENKVNIKPYTYLPFGAGPRNCIGSRFALLETKTLFFYILANFQIVPVKKTKIPLVLSKKDVNLMAEGGFWLGLKRRTMT